MIYDTGEFFCFFDVMFCCSSIDREIVQYVIEYSPIIVISLFLVMVLNLFGHVAGPSCNFVLRILKHLLAWALRVNGILSLRHQKLVDSFPTDVHQVRRDFDFDPITLYV
jgi:hypothetical protein